jgi:formamidopyrimidine-DNA glycosylase
VPEILEVETYLRQAEPVVGRRIVGVEAPDAWYVKRGEPEEVVAGVDGRRVEAIRRRGKLLILDLDDGVRLGLRFGMTGRLIIDGQASIERLEYSSSRSDPVWDRFVLHFTGGRDLRMRDPRRLGGVELEPDEARLGADAFTVSLDELTMVLVGSRAPLKARLLDQARVAGIGNLLADEMLWRAELDPARPAGSLVSAERSRLHQSIVTTLPDLLDRGGSHTGDLRAGALTDGRCPRDGTPLERRRIGGRTTLSCPTHQR